MASTLVGSARIDDVVVRYGGEKFLLVPPGVGAQGAAVRAEQWRALVAGTEIDCGHARLRVSVSAGVAEVRPGTDPESVLHDADAMLYRAKAAGRDRVEALAP